MRLTLQHLLQILPGHRLPEANAVELVIRLCGLLPAVREPLLHLPPGHIQLLPGEALLIGGAHRFGSRPVSLQWPFGYLTPEHTQGQPSDERSDVFNLAVILYECVAGESLFVGQSDFAVLEAVRMARLPPRPETIPAALHAVLGRALARDPADRFHSVREFTAALDPFRVGSTLDELLQRVTSAPSERPTPTTRLVSGDEGARLVYADFLEEQGRPDEANWLRQESALRSLIGEPLQAALRALRPLSEKVGTAFMASVSRPALEGCTVRFGFKCPLKWEALQRTEREDVRHCGGCQQDVRFVRTLEEAQEISARGGCVAIDPSVKRSEGDLHPAQYVMGQGL